jgi:hypothetical protein
LQSAVLIGGLIAIFVFKEVKAKCDIICFLSCGVLLIVGASVLANFGQCRSPLAD